MNTFRKAYRFIVAPVVKLVAALFLAFGISAQAGNAPAAADDWPQWGGPHRDFKSDVKGLPPEWPEGGPRRVWSRPLGDGYSSIAAEGGNLFTMYRRDKQEVVIALDAASGKTLWEYGYDAPFSSEYILEQGPGPRATPLVTADFVFASGATGILTCLDKKTGKKIWSHDLIKEFNGTVRVRGYSCSPLAWKNTVIMMVGGKGNAIMAFNQKDGAVVWKKHDFANSPSSPLLINVDGQPQLVAFMFNEVVGINPDDGELLWSHPHTTDYGLNISTPVWGEGNLLFFTSAYGGGSRVIKLTRQNKQTKVEELWFHRRMRVHFSNCVRIGDTIYGSTGDFGPSPFAAVNVRTGDLLWRDRNIAKASFIYADGRFIIVDEDGNLALASPASGGLKIHSKVPLLASNAWTAPTIAGNKLYVRDRKDILALELKGS
jgi:outer membrane protein assembly factor BamB